MARARWVRRMEDGCAVGVFRYGAGEHQPPHAHDMTSVSMVLRGTLEERVGPTSVRARALHAVVKPAGTMHENRFVAVATTLIQIALPSEVVREADDAGCPLDRWRWVDGPAAIRPMVRMARLCRQRADADALRDGIDEVLAAMDPVERSKPVGAPPAWLRRVRQAIREAAGTKPLTVRELADDAGVHRVHLSREFRRWFGVSPTEYRQRMRLGRAVERVGASTDPLSRAACGAGFADQAHMTREFRRRLGATPLEYRRLTRA